MRHFCKIADGLDVVPVLNALAVNPHLWNAHDLRTTHPESPHQQGDDIWFWFNPEHEDPRGVIDDLDCVPYPAWDKLPQVRNVVLDIMRRVEGTRLGRVIITRLAPGAAIPAHIDDGAPATYYTRYQLALQSLPGALMKIGEEVVNFRMGEVWQIDNRTEHSVVNNSADDRIALIIDVRGPVC